MTVTTTLSQQSFPGNGGTIFPFNFRFFRNSHITVTRISAAGVATPLTENVDYLLTGAQAPNGGQVETSVGIPTGERILIERIMPAVQETSIRNQGAFFPAVHEDAFDYMTMLIQQSLTARDQALIFPSSDPVGIPNVLPDFSDRKDKVLAFSSDGSPIASTLTLEQLEQQPALALDSAQQAANSASSASSSAATATAAAASVSAASENIAKLAVSEFAYQSASISSGVSSISAATAGTWGILLNQNVTTLNISGATVGSRTVINLIVTQDSNGQRDITFPASVRRPLVSPIISIGPGTVSLLRLTSIDGGTSWFLEKLNYYLDNTFILPTITGENSTFTDEGTSTTGWTTTNSTVSSASSRTLFTKTSASGTGASMVKAVTLPTANRDFSLFGKVKVKNAPGNCATIWLFDGTKELGIWFGSSDGGGTITAGAMSITGYTTSRTVQSFTPGIDYGANDVDFELAYDSTFGAATLYFRQPDGSWIFKTRIFHTWFAVANIAIMTPSASAAGVTVDFDYLMIARPNILAIGDSICAGSTGFSPDPSSGRIDYSSTWMRYAKLYLSLRNNRVGNKGINGQTSAQTLSRISDVTNQSPQLVFLHASTNDPFQSIAKPARTTNIQNTINAIAAVSAKTVLLNGMYGVQGSSENTTYGLKDYEYDWWLNYRFSVTGLSASIDISLPVANPNGYMNPAYAQSDQLHPNPTGYQLIGQYIQGS